MFAVVSFSFSRRERKDAPGVLTRVKDLYCYILSPSSYIWGERENWGLLCATGIDNELLSRLQRSGTRDSFFVYPIQNPGNLLVSHPHTHRSRAFLLFIIIFFFGLRLCTTLDIVLDDPSSSLVIQLPRLLLSSRSVSYYQHETLYKCITFLFFSF